MKKTLFALFCSVFTFVARANDINELLLLPDHPERGKWISCIKVMKPNVLSDLTFPTPLYIQAKGLTKAVVRCGNTILTPKGVKMDAEGKGTVWLNPKKLPAGPIHIQIIANNPKGECDIYELQLWNNHSKKKTKDREGIPTEVPEGAKGMKLDFQDDFDRTLSISKDGRGARWNAHKPTFGDFSGWPFSDPDMENGTPFALREGFLVITAEKKAGTSGRTGLISPVDMDGKGYWAKPPFYMECRFMAHSAPGTWPAFWTITNIHRGPGDELDIIEAYGGWGDKTPGNTGYYTTTHYWEQKDEQGNKIPSDDKLITKPKDDTSWSQDFHTYGVRVDEDSTTYYRDNKPVHQIPTSTLSFTQKHAFLINYAIGGASGWHIDLERYGNRTCMFVDYVRVFTAD